MRLFHVREKKTRSVAVKLGVVEQRVSHRRGGHASGSNPAHGTHTLPTCAAARYLPAAVYLLFFPSHELNKGSGQRFLERLCVCGQRKDVTKEKIRGNGESRALILRRFFRQDL